MLKRLLIGTNLKMHKTAAETAEYLRRLQELTADISREELTLFVLPSFTALERANAVRDGSVLLGAQNMYPAARGAFAGEISVRMLREFHLDIVMAGHSERRHIFGETDETEGHKVGCALENGMVALLCIGETAEQRDSGSADEILQTQLHIGLKRVTPGQCEKLWVAYEPVWAIGNNGQPATAAYADERHRVIRHTLLKILGKAGTNVPIIYGGSVNPENAVQYIALDSVDGLFTGRSAWYADAFNVLLRRVLPVWRSRATRRT